MNYVEDVQIAELVSKLPYPLDQHQIDGIKFLTTHHRVLLADKMGLGKSITALASAYLRGSLLKRTFIPCSSSALSVWKNEIKLWFPELYSRVVVVEGTKVQRTKLWAKANAKECIYVCTYNILKADQDMIPTDWDLIIGDEIHKAGRNHKVQTYQILETLNSFDMYLITGSPASKGVRHMYGYLHLLYPGTFSSYWKFINRYCIIENGQFGQEIIGNQNMEEFKEILSQIMLRRVKTGSMPKKYRRKFWVKMSKEEANAYSQIDTTGILGKSDGTYLLSPIQATNQLRCRQLFICPKLLDPALDVGTGIRSIAEHINEQEIDHTVIFCPFPAAFTYLKPFLEKELKYNVYILKGGLDSKEVQRTIDDWKNCKQGIILCSIQFATSFNLTKASIGYMLGFEWDQNHNYQAEDRLHRMGIKEDVTIYYVMHDNILTQRQLIIMDDKVMTTNDFIIPAH